MAGLCPTSATQTTQTTAGLSPWSQPYVSSMLGAAQQQVFNTDPTTGKVTGIVPYMAFGAPVSAQGQPVPYQGMAQPISNAQFNPTPPSSLMSMDPNARGGVLAGLGMGLGSLGGALGGMSAAPAPITTPETPAPNVPALPEYPSGTMQAGMGPGEMMAARSAVAAPGQLQQTAAQTALGMQTQIGRAHV